MKKVLRKLQTAQSDGHIVRVHRTPRRMGYMQGFCTEIGEQWAVMHRVSSDVFLDGHGIFPVGDVRDVEVHDELLAWGLQHLGEGPPVTLSGLDLSSVQGVVASAATLSPLIVIYTERAWPDECYIGVPIKAGRSYLHLQEVDPRGRWERTRKYAWQDITQVQLGGRYERVLEAKAGPRPESAKTSS